MRRFVRGMTFSIVLGAGTLPLRSTQAQAPQCDPAILPLAQGDFGYRTRDDRCEGTYAQKVGGSVLTLASVTESFPDYDPATVGDLILEWTQSGAGPIRLEARAVTQRLHYRMETIRPASDSAYRWPSNVLHAQSIARSELGVTASVSQLVGGVSRNVYLPLRITEARSGSTDGARAPPAPTRSYELVIYPTARVRQLFLTVTAVGADGRPTTYIQRDQELSCEYCPADQPIPIQISGLTAAGIYFVEISARLTSGGSAAIEQWLYHPGPRR